MLPKELQNRADYIFREMGGHSQAALYLSEQDIVDTCLYPGTVFVLTYPDFIRERVGSYSKRYSPAFDITSVQQITPSSLDTTNELYDLELWGYQPSSYYYILDKDLRLIYKNRAKRLRINGQLSSFFGYDSKDIEYLLSLKHGEVFYITFDTPTGPISIRVVLNTKPNPFEHSQYLKQARAVFKASRSNTVRHNELHIDTTDVKTHTRLHLLEGSLKQAPSVQAICFDRETISIDYLPLAQIYIKTDKGAWFCLREYTIPVPYLATQLTNTVLSNSLETLELAGYNEVNNISNSTAMSTSLYFHKKNNNGIEEDIVLDVNESQIVESAIHTSYRVLSLDEITGSGRELLVQRNDGAMYIQPSTRPTVNQRYPLEGKLTTGMRAKTTFNVYAKAKL